MQLANPYQQYKEQSLSALSQGEILIKLYDEVIKQLSIAKIKLGQNDLSAVNAAITKSQDIISVLADSLDMRFPISKELREMYIFLTKHLLNANLKKDAKMIDDCLPLIRDLRDSFQKADQLSRKSAAPQRINIGGRAV